jgi:hypothetical protein
LAAPDFFWFIKEIGMSDVNVYLTFGVHIGNNYSEVESAVDKIMGEGFWDNTGPKGSFKELIAKELKLKECPEEALELRNRNYYSWLNKRDQAIKLHGIELVSYGNSDDPYYIICVRNKFFGEVGDCQVLNPDDLEIPDQDIIKLVTFCKKYGISFTKPEWYINSYDYS